VEHKEKSVVVLDTGICNLNSLALALEAIDVSVITTSDSKRLSESRHLIIPGVGAFDHGMQYLRRNHLPDAISEFVQAGGSVLGICLGMQLLFDSSDENGSREAGLSLIPGHVQKIKCSDNLTWPHIGWNAVNQLKDSPLFSGIENCTDFYFVHGYGAYTVDPAIGITNHGEDFASVVNRGNVFGVQFHPEKSQHAGVALLRNFISQC
jgi:glutamine amidotransferase